MYAHKLLLKDDTDKQSTGKSEANKFLLLMVWSTKELQYWFVVPGMVISTFIRTWSANDNKLHHLLGAFIYKAFKHRLLYYESKLKPTLNSAQSVHIYNIHLVAMTNWPSLVL